jgi:hypothetical protein
MGRHRGRKLRQAFALVLITFAKATAYAKEGGYFALVGDSASFRSHINGETYQMLNELSTRYQWRHLSIKKALRKSRDGAPNRTSWAHLERQAVTDYGCLPSALLFVIKFHWNYLALERLGPRLGHHMHGTHRCSHPSSRVRYCQNV